MSRPSLVVRLALPVPALAFAFAVPACVAPSNPCDPGAPIDAQAEGTVLGGRVVDDTGAGVAGVTVAVVGFPFTAVSGSDGAWRLENIPPSPTGYTLRAEVLAPRVGGTTSIESLGCKEQRDDVELVVVAPVDPPEVEIVRAVDATSLVVAFGSGDDGNLDAQEVAAYYDVDGGFRTIDDVAAGCAARLDDAPRSWRVQVRPPFDTWHDAVLSAFPWATGEEVAVSSPGGAAAVDGALIAERTEDFCAAALCAQFAYLDTSLSDPRARCANVVGFVDEGVVAPLEPFGTYDVRVLTETRVTADLVERFALPELVTSAAPAAGRQMSLVPGSLLPLIDNTGAPIDTRDVAVHTVLATAGGRFALVSEGEVTVLGGGDDVLGDAEGTLNGAAPQGALAEDALTNTTANADLFDDGDDADNATAVAALAAGDWLRVVKEGDAGAVVEKVYIGADAAAGELGADVIERRVVDDAELTLPVSPTRSPLGALRAISYLNPGAVALSDATANPDDAYLLLHRTGFVLVENSREGQLRLNGFAPDDEGAPALSDTFADGVDGNSSGLGGACAATVAAAGGAFTLERAEDDADDGAARVELSLCYDVAAATNVDVDFRDADVIADAAGPVHVIVDAKNDRVVRVDAAALTDPNQPLHAALQGLPVGRAPTAIARSRMLDCGEGGSGDVEVVLVANSGSADVSVVAVDGPGLAERAIVPLPEAPVGFLDDADGPTCASPFAWAIAADGQLFPIDMRGVPSAPLCDGDVCRIGTRGRARSGAVGQRGGTSRALVGGVGLVGELGFFRPKALTGGAFLDGDDVTAPATGER
jgi:hypothetical protein